MSPGSKKRVNAVAASTVIGSFFLPLFFEILYMIILAIMRRNRHGADDDCKSSFRKVVAGSLPARRTFFIIVFHNS